MDMNMGTDTDMWTLSPGWSPTFTRPVFNSIVEDMMICCVAVETLAGSEFKPRFPTSPSGLYGAYVLAWGFSRRSFPERICYSGVLDDMWSLRHDSTLILGLG